MALTNVSFHFGLDKCFFSFWPWQMFLFILASINVSFQLCPWPVDIWDLIYSIDQGTRDISCDGHKSYLFSCNWYYFSTEVARDKSSRVFNKIVLNRLNWNLKRLHDKMGGGGGITLPEKCFHLHPKWCILMHF